MKQVLVKPILTEKTIVLANAMNQYTFEVVGDANKNSVADAIAKKFAVKVEAVKIVNRLGKMKRFGARSVGRRQNTKRAIVKLEKND